MADLHDSLSAIAVVIWSAGERKAEAVAEIVDSYLGPIEGSASEKFAALDRLRTKASASLGASDNARVLMQVIDTRLAELTASMVNANVAPVRLDFSDT